jgi:hypothetical protein
VSAITGVDALETTNSQSLPSVEQRLLDHRVLSVVTISNELYLLQVNINRGHKKKQRNSVLFGENLFPLESPCLLRHDASRIYAASYVRSVVSSSIPLVKQSRYRPGVAQRVPGS